MTQSAHSQPLPELSETEYLQMEEALCQSVRGRAFLRMRDRRTRAVSVDDFQRVAQALERQVDRLSGLGLGQGREVGPVRSGAGDAELPAIQRELSAISQFVQRTHSDVAALRPADSGANRIEAATGELDAIVAATERATTDILNATERIQEWTARIPRADSELAEAADAIEAWCIEILTSCSFQDITGQRTIKVVNTLRYIEQRVNTMIEIWGVDKTIAAAAVTEGVNGGGGGDAFSASHRKMNDDRPDAHLLNGPALGGGVDQSDIDALFDTLASEMPQVFERAEPAAPPPPPPPPLPPSKRKDAGGRKGGGDPPGGDGGGGNSQSDIDRLFM